MQSRSKHKSQPSGARGQFNSYGAALSTGYEIAAEGVLYSVGSTCY